MSDQNQQLQKIARELEKLNNNISNLRFALPSNGYWLAMIAIAIMFHGCVSSIP